MKCPKCHSDNPDGTRFCGNCASPLQPSEEVSVSHTKTLETPVEELIRGTTFAGRYEIIEELGKGGMGKVYRVLDKKLNEEVALKLIKPEIASDRKTLERFSNELKIARKIVHKNVGRMYELLEEKGTHYITMEYIPGQDLRGLIRQTGQLATGSSLSIAKQICEGLAEAHRLGVVHRDLKPSNIMVDKEGNVRVMDFGIARSLKEKGITGAGVMIGTPEYMSPEQAEAKEADYRSDIYSLGVILYEMVTGQLPFVGDTPLSIAMKHKGEKPKDPRDLNPQVPEDISHLILKCMEKDKENRHQSAEELHAELDNIEKGIPTTQREAARKKPITSKEITVKFRLKNLLIPALVIVALVIMAVIVWQLLPQKEAVSVSPSKPRIAVLPFEDLSPQKDQEYFCDGLAEEVINSLTHVKGLDVVAPYSSFSFKGKDMDISEISKILNVETVLKGSVRKSGNRLRVISQLINSDGYNLWSQKYEREMNEVFTIQDEISLAIVNKLKVNLLGEEQAALQKQPTEDMEAYNLYLKGMHFGNQVHPEDLMKGIEYFQRATERDPNFALAYVGIAGIYDSFAFLGLLPPNETYPKAKAALSKALEIDNTLAEAHALLANASTWHDWDWAAAEKGFKKAITLKPGLESTHTMYAMYLFIQGRFDEAITEIRLAQELSPLDPYSSSWAIQIYRCAGRLDEAMEQVHKAMETDPNFPMNYFQAATVYQTKEMYQKAIEAYQDSLKLSGGTLPWAQCGLGVAYAVAGERDKAEAVLKKLLEGKKGGYVPCLSIANNYYYLGYEDKALEWIERAYEQHDFLMPFLKVWPEWEIFRSHPRGKAILKKMNLDN